MALAVRVGALTCPQWLFRQLEEKGQKLEGDGLWPVDGRSPLESFVSQSGSGGCDCFLSFRCCRMTWGPISLLLWRNVALSGILIAEVRGACSAGGLFTDSLRPDEQVWDV